MLSPSDGLISKCPARTSDSVHSIVGGVPDTADE
jgi:hypothetical protein